MLTKNNWAPGGSGDKNINYKHRNSTKSSSVAHRTCVFLKSLFFLKMKTVRHLGRGAFGQVRLCLTEPGDQFSNAASLPSDASSQPDQNLAFQPALVAVKLVDLSGLSRQLRKRALKEAKLLQKLSRHPNIIECFDVLFGEKDVLQIVLEFAPCGDLHQHCEKNGRCGEKKALGWGGQILSALAYCHAKKILHRDLKPANILLFGGGRAKLADFGVCFVGRS